MSKLKYIGDRFCDACSNLLLPGADICERCLNYVPEKKGIA